MTSYTRREFLESMPALMGAASLLPSRLYASDGSLTGRVYDMFSNAPISNAVVTLIKEDTGEVFKTETASRATAVEESTWGQIKSRRDLLNLRKPVSLQEGDYSIALPSGTYTVALTDQEIPAAKSTSGDLFALQYNQDENLFVPRVFKLRVNGNTYHDEEVVPRGTYLEFLWTVLSGKVARYDYENTIFYVDVGPARRNYRQDSKGKLPEQWEVDNVVSSIKEFVALDALGKVTPRIEIGVNSPEFVPNPDGGNRVPEGYALFFWDSALPTGVSGTGINWTNEQSSITSSSARYRLGMTNKKTAINEVVGSAGLHGEPGTNLELAERIKESGGSTFLDEGPDEITPRDAQRIKYH